MHHVKKASTEHFNGLLCVWLILSLSGRLRNNSKLQALSASFSGLRSILLARITQTSKWKSFSVLNARFSCKKALEFYMHLFSKACNRSKILIWALRDKAEVTMEQQHLLRCTTRALRWPEESRRWLEPRDASPHRSPY